MTSRRIYSRSVSPLGDSARRPAERVYKRRSAGQPISRIAFLVSRFFRVSVSRRFYVFDGFIFYLVLVGRTVGIMSKERSVIHANLASPKKQNKSLSKSVGPSGIPSSQIQPRRLPLLPVLS